MPPMNITPFLDRLQGAKNVLIAGCGGGFDVFVGMPLATHLMNQGVSVIFANLSFSNLQESGAIQVNPVTWLIDMKAKELPYFPEKWLAEWLSKKNLFNPIYAFSKTGVRPLQDAFAQINHEHSIDLVILVDGGTDSLIFGDEPGLGTVVEDAISILAACQAAGDRTLLAAIGFGVDHFHGVSHHSYLENVAKMIRADGYLGSFSINRQTPEADAFLDLVDHANRRQPKHRSIVCNSIASAIRGEFGNYQATGRTNETELFINPLMSQYWTFEAQCIVSNMHFAASLMKTENFPDASAVIESIRDQLSSRPFRPIPL